MHQCKEISLAVHTVTQIFCTPLTFTTNFAKKYQFIIDGFSLHLHVHHKKVSSGYEYGERNVELECLLLIFIYSNSKF